MDPEVKDNGATAEGMELRKLQLRVQRIMVEGQKEDLELHSTVLKFGNLMQLALPDFKVAWYL